MYSTVLLNVLQTGLCVLLSRLAYPAYSPLRHNPLTIKHSTPSPGHVPPPLISPPSTPIPLPSPPWGYDHLSLHHSTTFSSVGELNPSPLPAYYMSPSLFLSVTVFLSVSLSVQSVCLSTYQSVSICLSI